MPHELKAERIADWIGTTFRGPSILSLDICIAQNHRSTSAIGSTLHQAISRSLSPYDSGIFTTFSEAGLLLDLRRNRKLLWSDVSHETLRNFFSYAVELIATLADGHLFLGRIRNNLHLCGANSRGDSFRP